MSYNNNYFNISILIILLSTPIGYFLLHSYILASGKNLVGSYQILLVMLILSFIIVGLMFFIKGLFDK